MAFRSPEVLIRFAALPPGGIPVYSRRNLQNHDTYAMGVCGKWIYYGGGNLAADGVFGFSLFREEFIAGNLGLPIIQPTVRIPAVHKTEGRISGISSRDVKVVFNVPREIIKKLNYFSGVFPFQWLARIQIAFLRLKQ